MENGIARDIFNAYRGQSCNNTTFAWETEELHPSRFCWGNNNNSLESYQYATTTAPVTARVETDEFATHIQGTASHALVFPHHQGNGTTTSTTTDNNQYSLHHRNRSHLHPDPHLVCLRLGKRHYFEDSTSIGGNGFSIGKRSDEVPYYDFGADGVRPSSSRSAAVPMCQVEGCQVALVNVKEYHRRHKVCEKHSKAPKVVVLGLEQRFCQQCSRFHLVSEFDDSKRSCRKRLAGHNQRRRKTSHDSISRTSSQEGNGNRMTGRFQYLSSPSTGCAHSLLSSGADSWVSPSDLSSRSSAALRELIEENRASVLARQLVLDPDWQLHLHHHSMEDMGEAQTSPSFVTEQQHHQLPEPHGWERFSATGSNVTLDLMQASSSAVSMYSVRGEKQGIEEEE
ncbi:hypothetical protein SLE2022_025890 [Rubroshorea leprosula]